MKEILIAIVVPVLGGLGYVAVSHPKTYRWMAWRLHWLFVMAWLAVSTWYLGVYMAQDAVLKVITEPQKSLVLKQLEFASSVQTYAAAASACIAIALGILWLVSRKIEDERREQSA